MQHFFKALTIIVIGIGDNFLQPIIFVLIMTCIFVWNDHSDNVKRFFYQFIIVLSGLQTIVNNYNRRGK